MALPAVLAVALAAVAARAAPAPRQAADPSTAPIKVDVGQIKGARFAIANPPVEWNRKPAPDRPRLPPGVGAAGCRTSIPSGRRTGPS